MTQTPGTKKKSLKLSGPKKNHATSQDKKNRATSRDKKKSCNLSGQKNHKTSGTKKACNLSGQKKITLIGLIASKLVNKAPNCSKRHQICPNRIK